MTKLETVKSLRQHTGITHLQAVDAVEIFIQSIKETLKTGKKVSFVGFGTFRVKPKRPHKGRNPRTGESIQVPMKYVVVFKPGREFRQMVNNV
ncbi:MAG: integration host factor subunit beta [Candidatus Sumerlaeota bacterium]|nr:integration host factor subunit beta [Candidatus Sumerlaeota bacterium]